MFNQSSYIHDMYVFNYILIMYKNSEVFLTFNALFMYVSQHYIDAE